MPNWKLFIWPGLGFLLALSMHLWRLDQPAQLVSDEVYFVQEGWDYVIGQPYFDPHPPLGKMTHGLVFTMFGYHPLTWRMTNAALGALMAPLLWWLAWRLTSNRVVAAITLVLVLLDGLRLTESRLGMINLPYALYGLAALAGVLKALGTKRPAVWILLAGVCMGAAISTKWLALAVAVPALALWYWPKFFGQNRATGPSCPISILAVISFFAIPLGIYWLVFRLHFGWLGLPDTIVQLNLQMLNYQLSVPPSGDPNGLPWWGWLLAWKPFPYWGEVIGNQVSVIRSLPNPWIWWTGSIIFIYSLIRGWRRPTWRLLNIFLLANWLPYAFIRRIMYSYHELLFSLLLAVLVAVVLGEWWRTKQKLVIGYLALAIVVFAWFAPWFLNLPLSRKEHQWREWLPSWRLTTSVVTPRPNPIDE